MAARLDIAREIAQLRATSGANWLAQALEKIADHINQPAPPAPPTPPSPRITLASLLPPGTTLLTAGSAAPGHPTGATGNLLSIPVSNGIAVADLSSGDNQGSAPVSIGLAMPADFTVTGSPAQNNQTITVGRATEAANAVLAGPASGAAAVPAYRALVAADVPNPAGDVTGTYAATTVTDTHLTNPLPVAQGGTGTASPALVAGTGIAVSGSFPDQTVALTTPVSVANGGTGTASPALVAGTGITLSGSFPAQTVALTTPVAVANGGTGTATPSLVAGTDIAITGSWPNQTIAAPVFVASGANHASGTVPDPGATAGTTHYLREDATWDILYGSAIGRSPTDAITLDRAFAKVSATDPDTLDGVASGDAYPRMAPHFGQNCLENPSFENPAAPNTTEICAGWETQSNVAGAFTLLQSIYGVFVGAHSLAAVVNPNISVGANGGSVYCAFISEKKVNAAAGDSFGVKGWLYTHLGGGSTIPSGLQISAQIFARVEFSDGTYSQFGPAAAGAWGIAGMQPLATYTVTAPTGKTILGIDVWGLVSLTNNTSGALSTGSNPAAAIYFDAFSLVRATDYSNEIYEGNPDGNGTYWYRLGNVASDNNLGTAVAISGKALTIGDIHDRVNSGFDGSGRLLTGTVATTAATIDDGVTRSRTGLDASGHVAVGTAATPVASLDSGASRANAAIDATNIVVAAGLDLSRSYTNKYGAYIPRASGDATTLDRAFAKGAATDPDTLDSVGDGTTYARYVASDATSNRLDFGKALLNKYGSNLPRSGTDATTLDRAFAKGSATAPDTLSSVPDDATYAKVRTGQVVQGTVNAVAGNNLLQNPSFESNLLGAPITNVPTTAAYGYLADNWYVVGGNTVPTGLSNYAARTGKNAAYFSPQPNAAVGNSGSVIGAKVFSTAVACRAGDAFFCEGFYNVESAIGLPTGLTVEVRIGLEFMDSTGAVLSNGEFYTAVDFVGNGSSIGQSSSTWTSISSTGVAPTGAAQVAATVQLFIFSTASGMAMPNGLAADVRFDDVLLSRVVGLDNEVQDGTTYVRLGTVAADHTLYLTTISSSPTDTPTAGTIRVDTTNDKLWVYTGAGGWKGVAIS